MARRQHGHELTDRLNGVALDVYHSFHDKYRRTRATHDALMPENLVPTMRFMMDVQGKPFDEQDESLLTEVAHEYALNLLTGQSAPSSGSIQSRIQRRISERDYQESLCSQRFLGLSWQRGSLAPTTDGFSDRDTSVIEPRPRDAYERSFEFRAPVHNPLNLSKLADEASAVADFPEGPCDPPKPVSAREALETSGVLPVQYYPFRRM